MEYWIENREIQSRRNWPPASSPDYRGAAQLARCRRVLLAEQHNKERASWAKGVDHCSNCDSKPPWLPDFVVLAIIIVSVVCGYYIGS